MAFKSRRLCSGRQCRSIPVPVEAIIDAKGMYLKKGAIGTIGQYVRGGGQKWIRDTSRPSAYGGRHSALPLQNSRSAREKSHIVRRKWFKYCQSEIPVGPASSLGAMNSPILLCQAMLNSGDKDWDRLPHLPCCDHLKAGKEPTYGAWAAGRRHLALAQCMATALLVLPLSNSTNRSHPVPCNGHRARCK